MPHTTLTFITNRRVLATAILLATLTGNVRTTAQQRPDRTRLSKPNATSTYAASPLTGVYRLDSMNSDKLFSLLSEADTNLPYAKQQRFFDDLTIRLTSPDQLAIEQRGSTISIASSRAPRLTLNADGRERAESGEKGRTIRTLASLESGQLVVRSDGEGADAFYVAFEPLDDGRRLRVTRRITTDGLNQPIIVRSIYNKVSDVARWSIFEESLSPPPAVAARPVTDPTVPTLTTLDTTDDEDVVTLRRALEQWIAATNANDIERQLSFYMPRVAAFYLARNVPLARVRAEKVRVFERAKRIDISAASPEVILRDDGRTAIMRFRKRYDIETARRNLRGEVIQELRWQRVGDAWKIFSERDVRVLQ